MSMEHRVVNPDKLRERLLQEKRRLFNSESSIGTAYTEGRRSGLSLAASFIDELAVWVTY